MRAAARVLVGCVVVSVLAGVGWGFLAPAEHLLVVEEGRGTPLTGESNHQFDSIAIYVCICAVVALFTAIATWQWRSMRGAVLYTGLLIGSGVGALTAGITGEFVARLRYPHVDAPAVHSVVALAPTVGTDVALLVQPLVASVAFLLLAALNPHDDLGSGTSTGVAEPEPVREQPVTA